MLIGLLPPKHLLVGLRRRFRESGGDLEPIVPDTVEAADRELPWALVYYLASMEVGALPQFFETLRATSAAEAWREVVGPFGAAQNRDFVRFLNHLPTRKAHRRFREGLADLDR